MIKYGLLFEGELLRVYYSREISNHCVGVSFHLDTSGDIVWLVDSKEVAENAANTSPEWYDAGYDTPTNGSYIGKMTVVPVEVKITN